MIAGVTAIAAAGCGARGPERFHASGTVTFGGKPVPLGSIRFEADGSRGNHGPVGHAAIVDGRYTTRTRGSRGMLRGPLVVIIDGGPLPATEGEPALMWFTDYKTTITLEPKTWLTTIDFDVPRVAAR